MQTTVFSTSDVELREGDEYWRNVMLEKYRTYFEPAITEAPYQARMEGHSFEGFTMARMRCDGQRSRRTPRLISDDDQASFMVSVVLRGHGELEQGERKATLQPRSITYWDTSRPATWHFDGPHDALLLRISHERTALYAATAPLLRNTASAASREGALGVAADFFLRLSQGAAGDPAGTRLLASQGAGILTSALALVAGGEPPSEEPGDDLLRQQVLAYLRANLADPSLTSESIARAVNVSRRSLYRLFESGDQRESVMGLLRTLRIERAKQLLVAHPHRSVTDIGVHCGFRDGQFSRAFRDATSMTPGAYRSATSGKAQPRV